MWAYLPCVSAITADKEPGVGFIAHRAQRTCGGRGTQVDVLQLKLDLHGVTTWKTPPPAHPRLTMGEDDTNSSVDAEGTGGEGDVVHRGYQPTVAQVQV